MGLLAAWAFDAPGGQLLLQTGCALQLVMGAVDPAVRHGAPGEQLPWQPT
ncbi:hypothetical protein SALBM311S_13086 [Streptomyces alboniger]